MTDHEHEQERRRRAVMQIEMVGGLRTGGPCPTSVGVAVLTLAGRRPDDPEHVQIVRLRLAGPSCGAISARLGPRDLRRLIDVLEEAEAEAFPGGLDESDGGDDDAR